MKIVTYLSELNCEAGIDEVSATVSDLSILSAPKYLP
jgi:hypothetical protein